MTWRNARCCRRLGRFAETPNRMNGGSHGTDNDQRNIYRSDEAGTGSCRLQPDQRRRVAVEFHFGPSYWAVDPAQRKQLADLGVEILEYVPDDTYVCRYLPQDLGAIRALPFVS